MRVLILILSILLVRVSSAADGCEVTTNREACPDKKVEAYKPYDGKNPTVEIMKATDEADCKKKAEKSSKIIRKGTLTAKTVTVKYNGKDLGKFNDKADCK